MPKRWWIAYILSTPLITGPPADRIAKAPDGWPNVHIVDPVVRDTTRRALNDAARWLSGSHCAQLFSEFQDADGQPLERRLRQLQSTPVQYLRLVYFNDGELNAPCKRDGILAFTQVGSRVVYVCGRDFARSWNKEPRQIVATLIHEMLHSLGLGENPPTPREISDRVQKLCWQ